MSIEHRIQDARLLYDHGRYEGALLSVLIAVAASSRIRFPRGIKSCRKTSKEMSDGEAFETFMAEEMQRVGACSVFFDGTCNPAEKVFYKWLRCSLAHEARLPDEIEFVPSNSPGEASLSRNPGPPERLVVTHTIVLLIGHVVCTAHENANIAEATRMLMSPRSA